MKLVAEGAEMTGTAVQAAAAGMAKMGVADVDVVTSADFAATIQRVTGESGYTLDRGAGVVAARTVESASGPVVVVNMEVVQAKPDSVVERLLAHEAGHVLLMQNAETTEPYLDQATSWGHGALMHLGGLALEEYRIERRVMTLGYPLPDTVDVAHLENTLYCFNADILEALYAEKSREPRQLMGSVIQALDWFTKDQSYLAAAALSGLWQLDLKAVTPVARASWQSYAGSSWEARLALYGGIPDCSHRFPRAVGELRSTPARKLRGC